MKNLVSATEPPSVAPVKAPPRLPTYLVLPGVEVPARPSSLPVPLQHPLVRGRPYLHLIECK